MKVVFECALENEAKRERERESKGRVNVILFGLEDT